VSPPSEQLIATTRAWIAQDPDPNTRAELEALLESAADQGAELRERFSGPLVFGTAGLRGIVGAGETRMNRAVVRRATSGLATYLLEHVADAATKGVVIGYDGRRMSHELAHETAGVLLARGFAVHLSDGVCPTPIVAFAVKHLGCAAGVMVTASHNPPQYNGFKVYAQNAAQIIAPIDALIATGIDASGPAHEIALADLEAETTSGRLRSFGKALTENYLDAIAALVPKNGDRNFDVAYTPLHGVGAPWVEAAMKRAGFDSFHTVAEQREPDGAFPTVEFPNPEEPGAMDAVLALAEDKDAPLVLANDPDADRLAVAVRDPSGTYKMLTGNELGVLLGHFLLEKTENNDRSLVIASLVSSPLLGVIAADRGARYEETLTGFKWIANRAMALEAESGVSFLFGYEEALGYTVGTVVRDKDGISAAVVLTAIAAILRKEGRTLLDELERIARRYGLYASHQHSLRFSGSAGNAKMAAVMAGLRENPPDTIGGHAIMGLTDCQASTRRGHDGLTTPLSLPKSNVLIYDLEGGHRVIARPSGTEPKLKFYFDVREPLTENEALEHARTRADEHIAALKIDLLHRLDI